MRPRREFRHYPAKRPVLLDLGPHDVGNDLPGPVGAPPHHRRGGFVAACLNPQNERIAIHCGDLVSGLWLWSDGTRRIAIRSPCV